MDDDTGVVRFPGHLDPTAEEFRPRNSDHLLSFFAPPPIYYPYSTSYYNNNNNNNNPNQPPLLSSSSVSGGGGVGYHHHHYPAPPAYVSSLPPPQPLQTPSRTLLLSSLPTNACESTVRTCMEVFGEIRAVQMERDGLIATVHFYDIRHAQTALTEVREQHMQQQCRVRNQYYGSAGFLAGNSDDVMAARGLIGGHALWAQYVVPTVVGGGVPDGHNQGTIVVFNLDSSVSTSNLKLIFQAFGTVKELRETPTKRHQKFIEFYDIRDAARALVEMNGKEIHGNRVVIEFSRPGGHGRKFFTTPSVSNSNPFNDYSSRNISSSHSSSNVVPRVYLCQPETATKKPKGSIGAVEASMSSLLISDGSVESGTEARSWNGVSRKNKKKQPPSMKIQKTKGRFRNFDYRFSVKEDAIIESNRRDSRTTVMIKNIPNKYSLKLILNMLDKHCIHCNEQISDADDQQLSSYDFVYLPIDFNNKCNVGYGFVNMTSPEATWKLYKAFHQQTWEVFNSKKICEVTYARVQGLESLKEHFKNSKFPSVTDEIFPVVFSPPRDGSCFTEPQPIFGHTINPDGPSTSTKSSDGMDGSDWPTQENEDIDDNNSFEEDDDNEKNNEEEDSNNWQ